MQLLSEGTRRALSRWDGRPRQALALLCAAAAALLALAGGPGEGSGGGAGPAAAAGGEAAGAAGGLAAGYVAAVVPAGPAVLAVAAGDRIDVYAATDGDLAALDEQGRYLAEASGEPGAELVASAARVLMLARPGADRFGSGQDTGYLVLEVTDTAARALAAHAGTRLTLVVRARDG